MLLKKLIAKYKKETIVSSIVTMLLVVLAVALVYLGYSNFALFTMVFVGIGYITARYSYEDYKNYLGFSDLLNGRG